MALSNVHPLGYARALHSPKAPRRGLNKSRKRAITPGFANLRLCRRLTANNATAARWLSATRQAIFVQSLGVRCEAGLSSSSIDMLAQDYFPSRPTDQFVTTSITVAAWLIKQYACRGHQDAVMKHGYFVVLHLDDA
jgi:hypothetical protein